MTLILTLANASLLSDKTDNTRMLEDGVLTIGRGEDSDWVLPDPTRQLSKRHCVISVQDGKYLLQDTSANGTIIGSGHEPLGQGNSIALRDGDRVTLGAYRLDVTIIDQARHAARPDADPLAKSTGPIDLFSPALSERDVTAPPKRIAPATPLGLGAGAGPLIPDDEDFLSPLAAKPAPSRLPPLAATPSDHAPPQAAFFAAPKVAPDKIPDNWDPFAEPGDGPMTPARGENGRVDGSPSSSTQASGLAAFLEGAGLDAPALPPEAEAKILRAAGAALREAVEGLRAVFTARGELRSTFQIEHTMLRAQGNNPLKFSESTAEALRAMLLVPGAAFLPADATMRESLHDVQTHQMAIIAGMQEALAVLLKRFEPQSLQKRMDSGASLSALLPGARKAKYWDTFCEIYQEVAAEAEGELSGLFRKAFARAYEEQAKSRR